MPDNLRVLETWQNRKEQMRVCNFNAVFLRLYLFFKICSEMIRINTAEKLLKGLFNWKGN